MTMAKQTNKRRHLLVDIVAVLLYADTVLVLGGIMILIAQVIVHAIRIIGYMTDFLKIQDIPNGVYVTENYNRRL